MTRYKESDADLCPYALHGFLQQPLLPVGDVAGAIEGTWREASGQIKL